MAITRLRHFTGSLMLASLPLVALGLPAVSLADPLGPCPVSMYWNVDTNQCEFTVVGPVGPGPVGPGPVGPGPVGPGPVGPGPVGPGPIGPGR